MEPKAGNNYDHKTIEKKWQEKWQKEGIYTVEDKVRGKKNFYELVEFTYPSGNLHVGHWYAFSVPDIHARFKRMQGYNVLYPMGFDAFGLPAENAAINLGADPKVWTFEQMEKMRTQFRSMGAMFDWGREVVSCDPLYYKWTQWMFNQFLKKDLVYRANTKVNWCPKDQTILANEQVIDGKCDRCGSEVIQRDQEQWMLRITKYADRLVDDLEKLDWPEEIKAAQRNWIGRSEGSEIDFKIKGENQKKYIIFDFDGVIGDTYNVRTQYRVDTQGLSHKESIEKNDLYDGRKPTHSRGADPDEIAREGKWVKDFADYMVKQKLDVFSGFVDEIKKIDNLTYAIVSSGSAEYINPLLQKSGLTPTHVLTYEDHHSKEEKVENICKAWGVGLSDIYYVTDTKADVYELEEILRVSRIIGCAWGYQGYDKLKEILPEGNILKEFSDIHRIGEPTIKVFTTRVDTLFGVTYVVLAPEHTLLQELISNIENRSEVEAYITVTKKKLELERQQSREKTGIELKGIKAINPANGEEIPVWIADYVLSGYGTGAVMAVPAHDERDFEFAKKYGLSIKEVVADYDVDGMGWAPREHKKLAMYKGVSAVVFNKKDDTILCLKWTPQGWGTFITGKVEENEDDCEKVAKREIYEETGYKNIALIYKQKTPYFTSYYHDGKDENRFTEMHRLFFELVDEEQDDVADEEKEKHQIIWVKRTDIKKFITASYDQGVVKKIIDKAFSEISYFTGHGILVESGAFNGLTSEEAKQKITEFVGGRMLKTYRLRDWGISRQRYWGCPIPIVYDPDGKAHPVPDEHLPWMLPTDVDHTPSGVAPLAKSKELFERTEKLFGKGWKPEVETMDTFVDSSWYFYRYLDNKNEKEFADQEKMDAWMPIDLYMGGAEHTTMHLLYSRFWVKALYDLGLVKEHEAYKIRRNRGIILAPDGNKMSKSKGNAIDPDEIVERLGADTVRLYLAFMGPYGVTTNYPWDPNGVVGVRRFLERVWRLKSKIDKKKKVCRTDSLVHKTIQGVAEDIEAFKFNTAIAKMMIFVNALEKEEKIVEGSYLVLLRLLAPFVPHMTEELWYEFGESESIHLSTWPTFDESMTKDEVVTVGVQINGKVRAELSIASDASKEEIEKAALALPRIQEYLAGGQPKRIIVVPGRTVNIVL